MIIQNFTTKSSNKYMGRRITTNMDKRISGMISYQQLKNRKMEYVNLKVKKEEKCNQTW